MRSRVTSRRMSIECLSFAIRGLHRLLWGAQSKLPRKLGEQTLGVALHLYNQLLTRRQVRQVVAEKGIDIVHETMPISPKATSVMFGLGVPVVIGPMCGGMDYPPAFQYLQGRFTRTVEHLGRRSFALRAPIGAGQIAS